MDSFYHTIIGDDSSLPIHREPLVRLLNSLTEIIGILDKDGRFVYVNTATFPLWGYKPEEVVGRSCIDFMADGQPADSSTNGPALGGDPAQAFVNRYCRKDGTLATMEWNGYWDHRNQLYYVTGKDISEQKKKEETLNMLSLIAKETVNAVTFTDREGKIVWVNQSFTELTGYTKQEVVGRTLPELLQGPDTDTTAIADAHAHRQRGESFCIEIRGYKKSKEPYWSHVLFKPMFDETGALYRYMAIQTDVTEQKQLQEQLAREVKRQQRQITASVIQAQEKERALISQELHDNVNQVLTTVKLYTELCLSPIENRGELLQKSVELLQATINEIRNLSKRLSAPSLGAIPLKESIKDLIDTIAATNKLNITYHTFHIHKLNVDQELHLAIYRILQEHFTNILKHAQAQKVSVTICNRNNILYIKVEDDGMGFDVRKRSQGIGITNMLSRVENENGRMRLRSAPGRGCTLKLAFPHLDKRLVFA